MNTLVKDSLKLSYVIFVGFQLNGENHSEVGPAIEMADGDKQWWLNGKRHREDGPAVEWISGYKAWWLNGKLHREGGPAIELSNGHRAWFLNGKAFTEEEYWATQWLPFTPA